MNDRLSEDAMAETLDLIRGTGKYSGLGTGLTLFHDRCSMAEYCRCIELEKRGQIKRKAIEGGVEWEATGLRIAD